MEQNKQIEEKLRTVIDKVLTDTKNCDMSIETLSDYLVDRIMSKLPENAVVLNKDELTEKYVPIYTFIQVKEELEFVKKRLKIKTDEAEWRADQLQALDKDFETMEKVVRCKDCRFYEEKHYEDEGEKPYIKRVCKILNKQFQPTFFCCLGEEKRDSDYESITIHFE